MLLQLGHALISLTHPLGAFELERLGHDADGQDAHLAGGLRDDRGSAGAGAAAHPGGDEAHMRALQVIDDILDRFLGRAGADIGLGAGAQPFGHFRTQLDAAVRFRLLQRLRVGVGDNENAALKLLIDHVVDRVPTCPADTEHGDARAEIVVVVHRQIEVHGFRLLLYPARPRAGGRIRRIPCQFNEWGP